jgi:predicted nucleic acid-binding protein
MNIIADSNYFIALANPNDTLHKKAIQISNRIDMNGDVLCINNLVFIEIVTIISQKISKDISMRIGEDILSEKDVSFLKFSEKDFNITWNIFKDINYKNISFVDCSIITSLKYFDTNTILTFDLTDFNILNKNYKFKFYF